MKIMQNLVMMIQPPQGGDDISLKAGNMFLNRFIIDEDVAFELSGIYNAMFRKSVEDRGEDYSFDTYNNNMLHNLCNI